MIKLTKINKFDRKYKGWRIEDNAFNYPILSMDNDCRLKKLIALYEIQINIVGFAIYVELMVNRDLIIYQHFKLNLN